MSSVILIIGMPQAAGRSRAGVQDLCAVSASRATLRQLERAGVGRESQAGRRRAGGQAVRCGAQCGARVQRAQRAGVEGGGVRGWEDDMQMGEGALSAYAGRHAGE